MSRIFFILCIAVNCIYSQEYSGFAYEMFFGRQPSARVEALGKGLITIEDGANSSFYNPSLIGQTKGLNFSYSHSDPYYYFNDASYQYFGISYKTGIHAFAINKFSLDYKFLKENLTKSIYKLNYAIAPKEGFSAGVNINYYSFYGEPNYEGFMFDVGALKEFKLEESPSSLQKLNTAFVFKNVLRKTIEIDDNLIEFPSTFEIGVSYSGKFKGEIPFYGLDFLNTFLMLNTES